MARRYYGLDRGETEFNVTEQATTPSKAVEVNFDLAAGLEKNEILIKLDEIKNHILKGIYPPA
jgi:hypothetical protein